MLRYHRADLNDTCGARCDDNVGGGGVEKWVDVETSVVVAAVIEEVIEKAVEIERRLMLLMKR